MSDPIANSQLELACRLGAINDIVEALEDGADINCNSGSPVFIAMIENERASLETLIEHGADVSTFIREGTPEAALEFAQRIDFLLACGGHGDSATSGGDSDDPQIDSKLVGALDRMIRRNGLIEPFIKRRGSDFPAFRQALGGIGAEDCHAVVSEFLDELESARAEQIARAENDEVSVFDDGIFLEAEAERIAEWSTRYVAAEESPPALAKEYLKERKKLEADA